MAFASADTLERRGRTWAEDYPHRRWFLDYYKLPPSDPRYLGMTDEEILLDFYSVAATDKALQAQWDAEDKAPPVFSSVEEARIEPAPMAPNQPRKLAVEADPTEFRTWYEATIGAWPD